MVLAVPFELVLVASEIKVLSANRDDSSTPIPKAICSTGRTYTVLTTIVADAVGCTVSTLTPTPTVGTCAFTPAVGTHAPTTAVGSYTICRAVFAHTRLAAVCSSAEACTGSTGTVDGTVVTVAFSRAGNDIAPLAT